MPLGFLMLLGIVAIVGGLWLYNAWPEVALRRLGAKLGVDPRVLLADRNATNQWGVLRTHLQRRYRSLCFHVFLFAEEVAPRDDRREDLRERLVALCDRRVNAENLRELRRIIGDELEEPAIAQQQLPECMQLELEASDIGSDVYHLEGIERALQKRFA